MKVVLWYARYQRLESLIEDNLEDAFSSAYFMQEMIEGKPLYFEQGGVSYEANCPEYLAYEKKREAEKTSQTTKDDLVALISIKPPIELKKHFSYFNEWRLYGNYTSREVAEEDFNELVKTLGEDRVKIEEI